MSENIHRDLEAEITARIGKGKTLVIHGARQVGKTTLLRELFGGRADVVWFNTDEAATLAAFENVTGTAFQPYLGRATTVVIDEAQRIPDIGLKLKILHDALGDRVQFIATGSSSFDLANKINEPLTGRKFEFRMHPVKFAEMVAHHGLLEERKNLSNRLLYGWYPDIIANIADARARLVGLAGDNLYKDIFRLEQIRKPAQFEKLVKALAWRVGSQVSLTELGALAGVDKNTAEKYVRLLEHAFIIFRVGSFSRNLRNELKTASKYYFFDTGIRNAVIGDFSPVEQRQDIGHLFENFVIAELVKRRAPFTTVTDGFWRTKTQQEIDFVEVADGALSAYEIKWNPEARARFPAAFLASYKPQKTLVLNRDNFFEPLLCGS
ncbi:MAG: ATP-binding protein [Puniceicoccales bacterium]|jgi:predicted AAA+ superfamily ATPase|nr:ATP-binding protein [Puniceicoccales bacterium]